jgi:hypothetical protein
MCDSGLSFGLKLRDRYRNGQCLGVPGDDGWVIGPEFMLDQRQRLGHFDDTLVMAIVAGRDPSGVMALSAAARVARRAVGRDLIGEVLAGVAHEASHAPVREVLGYVADRAFHPDIVDDVARAIEEKLGDMRKECFLRMKEGLQQLFDRELDPASFVERFFELSERTRIRMDVYGSMVQTLIRAKKVRPLVKVLLVEQVMRMPKVVRLQMISDVNAIDDPALRYLRQELAFVLEAQSAEEVRVSRTSRARSLLN